MNIPVVEEIIEVLRARLMEAGFNIALFYGDNNSLSFEIRNERGVLVEGRVLYLKRMRIPVVLNFSERYSKPVLVLTRFVGRRARERLRLSNVWYADLAGNVYIKWQGLVYIDISGNEKVHNLFIKGKRNLYTLHSAKVYFYLLKYGPLISATQREIASIAQVSLGKVSGLIQALEDRGILMKNRKNIEILRYDELVELFVDSYTTELKPRQFIGRYSWDKGYSFEKVFGVLDRGVSILSIAIGGEFGVDILTGRQSARRIDIWLREQSFGKTKSLLKLKRDDRGQLFLYRMFSDEMVYLKDWKGSLRPIAHPIILYADLLDSEEEYCQDCIEKLKSIATEAI